MSKARQESDFFFSTSVFTLVLSLFEVAFQRRHFLLQTVSQFTFRLISDFSAASLQLFVCGNNLVLFCIGLRMMPTALDANSHKLFFG